MIIMSTVFNIENMLGIKIHDINAYRIQHREHVKPCSCAGLELEHRIPMWLYCV